MAKSIFIKASPHWAMTLSRLPSSGHVEFEEKLGAEGFGQRLGVAGGLVVLVGDGDSPRVTMALPRRSDGLVVNDAGDQPLAGQGSVFLCCSCCFFLGSAISH